MPTYEYKCNKCGMQFEEYQSMTADPLTKCRNIECDGTVTRLFSAGAGFLFKGSGFYITDYRSDSYKKAASSTQGSGTAASIASSGSSTTSTAASSTSTTSTAPAASSTSTTTASKTA